MRGLGQTTTVACASCGSLIDISDENYRILQHYSRAVQEPDLALGSRGKLRGTEYEIIGFMVRTDTSGIYAWDEYLLFNPYKGFAWLMNYQGHWTYIQTITDLPAETRGSQIGYADRQYKLFLTGMARVKYVLGEFYWQVKLGDEVAVQDFICPPFILSRETSYDETVWSHGEYIEPEEISQVFNPRNMLPFRQGVGAAQPAPGEGYAKEVVFIGVLFILLLSAMQMIFVASADRQIVYDQFYPFEPGAVSRTVVSEAFAVNGHGNLDLRITAPVYNNWLSVDADLIDEKGSEVQGGEIEVGYYFGRDSDGAWSEGSHSNHALFSEVPPGLYRLSFQASGGPGLPALSYEIKAVRNVPYYGHYLLSLLLVGFLPLLLWIRRASFEGRRWQESDA